MGSLGSAYIPREITRDFEIQQQLSGSRTREAYLVTRLEDERLCVLRLDHTPLRNPRERRCLEESYIRLRRLRHPAFPEVIRFGVPRSGGHYLITEFARGVSLASLSREVDPPLLAEVLAKLLPPLHLLHLTGTVHQRLSPEKIIIERPTTDRVVRIAGIGLSRSQDGRRAAMERYSAPEVEYGGRFDGRADLYSLAATAYAAFNGGRPYGPRGRAEYDEDGPHRDVPPIFKEEGKDVAELEALLLRMGSHEPGYRPANALVAAKELERTGLAESPAPEIAPSCYVANTLWQVNEKKVKRLMNELEGLDREIRVTAQKELAPIAEELSHRTELRRSPRFVRVMPAAEPGSGPELDEEAAPDAFRVKLTVAGALRSRAEDGAIIAHRAENELHSEISAEASESDLFRWFSSFCMGPIDRRRSKLLAMWMHYEHKGKVEVVADYLAQLMFWDEGHARLDWEKVGEQLVDYIKRLPTQWPRGYHRTFPRRTLVGNANLIGRYCFPREAGTLLRCRALAETRPIARARLEFAASVKFAASGHSITAIRLLRESAERVHVGTERIAALIGAYADQLEVVTRAGEALPRSRTGADDVGEGQAGERGLVRSMLASAIDHQLEGRSIEARKDLRRAKLKIKERIEEAATGKGGSQHARAEGDYRLRLSVWRVHLAQATLEGSNRAVERMAERLRGDYPEDMPRLPLVQVLNLLARAKLRAGKVRECTRIALQAARQAVLIGDVFRATAAIINYAVSVRENEMRSEPAWLTCTATHGYREYENKSLARTLYNTLSASAFINGHYRRSKAFAERALSSCEAGRSDKRQAQVRTNLGLASMALGEGPRAVRILREALQCAIACRGSYEKVKASVALICAQVICGDTSCIREAASVLAESDAYLAGIDGAIAARWLLLLPQRSWHGLTEDAQSNLAQWTKRIRGAKFRPRTEARRDSGDGGASRRSVKEAAENILSESAIEYQLLWSPVEEDRDLLKAAEAIARREEGPTQLFFSKRLYALLAARYAALGRLEEGLAAVGKRRKLVARNPCEARHWGDNRPERQYTLDALAERSDRWLTGTKGTLLRLRVCLRELVEGEAGENGKWRTTASGAVREAAAVGGLLRKYIHANVLLVLQAGRTLRAYRCSTATGRLTHRDLSRGVNLAEVQASIPSWCIAESDDEFAAFARSGSGLVWVLVMGDRAALMSEEDLGSLSSKMTLLADSLGVGFDREPEGEFGSRRIMEHPRHDPAASSGTALIYRSREMGSVVAAVRRLAENGVAILLEGESGTGKELLAKYAHEVSRYAKGPFVPIDCPSLQVGLAENELFGHERGAFTGADEESQGLLAVADGGMAFLDEVGDLHPAIQAKLLRALSSRIFRRVGGKAQLRLNCGIVSATNLCLNEAVERGEFRNDLLHRLGVRVAVPPLRDRKEDIECLWNHFMAMASMGGDSVVYDAEIIDLLMSREWPGNVRELQNLAAAVRSMSNEAILRVETVQEALGRSGGNRGATEDDPSAFDVMPRLARAIGFIRSRGYTTRREYVRAMQVSPRTALRDLDEMVKRRYLQRVGCGRGVRYLPTAR